MPDAHPVPARYALNAAMREMDRIWDGERADYWTNSIYEMAKSGRPTAEGIERAISTIDSRIILSSGRMDLRRLGKIEPTFELLRMQPIRLVPRDGAGSRPREIIFLRRDVVTLRGREIDVRGANMGIALDRHAAERIYERGQRTPDGILSRLRDDMRQIIEGVGFARAAGLIKRARGAGPDEPPILPGYATYIPLGTGTLIVEAVQLDVSGVMARRTLLQGSRRSVVKAKTDPEMVVAAEPLEGHPAEGLLVMTGITYLSEDMLRADQNEYLAAFEHGMRTCDMRAIRSRVGRIVMPHEQHGIWPPVTVPQEMHEMLRVNVNRNKRPIAWKILKKDKA